MDTQSFDLVAIGSGPAGQKAAIAAAKIRKRAAVVDRRGALGGCSVHNGTIPSKTVREAVLYLTGFREKTLYGRNYTLKDRIAVQDLAFRVQAVITKEVEVIKAQFMRNDVTVLDGVASFLDPHTLEVKSDTGSFAVHADYVVIACGARPARDPSIPFDGKRVIDTDQLNGSNEIPKEAIVVGAGVIGLEYTSILAALGVKVTLIEQRPTVLDFVDREMVDALFYRLRDLGTTFRLGEKVVSVAIDEQRERVVAKLESGKSVTGAFLLYAVGRQANTDGLNLAAAGLEADPRGKLQVNEFFQTKVPHIYAAGDVIGFPALASTSMEQGRAATCHIFGLPYKYSPEFLPYGIYTVPEISMVGKTEEQLTAAKVPYETGISRYAELAKGQMLGDESGLLKLLFDPVSLKILGVHVIGDRASEIIHIGQAVMALGGTMEYLRDTVFNYPTLAEAYKVAALNGMNRVTNYVGAGEVPAL
ncbi:MAG: Si-specific NAD(P)(+) transhydrogenase [Candidatus Acidiferrales bacterium]